jgi:RNA polymerase-binding transcription factor DksA
VEDRTEALQRELNELQAHIDTLERNLEEKPDYGLGKGAPAITQWELDQILLQQLKARAVGIERTLSQTGENTYGTCEQCGKPIHPDRLAVLPNTEICIDCAKAGESRRGGW